MNAIEFALSELDGSWGGKWESLMSALKGVTEDEAAWQAPCYVKDLVEKEGWPKPGSILWQVAHIDFCKRYYVSVITGEPEKTPDRIPAATLHEELEKLRGTQEDLRAAIAALTESRLTQPAEKTTLHDFIHTIIRHDVWHAGQIAMARRLWANR
jgi:hypothetical protein